MKVLHFLDSINRGGSEVLALDVCRNAGSNGLDLTVVTTKGGILESDFAASPTKFVRLRRKYPIDIGLIRNLRKLIRENGINIVHAHQPVEAIHLFLATRGLKNIKRVMSFHGLIADAKNYYALQFLIPRMDANIVVSYGLLDWLKNRYKSGFINNFSVLYNGTDIQRLKPSNKSLKAELGINEKTRLIGMVANFYYENRKDQFTVCKALPDIFRLNKDAHCVFVGRIEEGAEHKFAECVEYCREQGISDRVHFLNARTDIPDILASLDIFILSSFHEGMPVALIEAMLAGKPAVVSDIAPFKEITADGKYAEIFPVGNHQKLAEKVVKLLNDKTLRDSLANSTLEFAKKNYSIEVHLKNLKNLYGKLL